MKKIGIILLVIQVIALLGAIINGSLLAIFELGGVRMVGNLLGFFLPGAIGLIFLKKARRRPKMRREAPEVVFNFPEPEPGEIEKMIAKRDAALQSMGYLPPDDNHECWWHPDEEKKKGGRSKGLKGLLERYFK